MTYPTDKPSFRAYEARLFKQFLRMVLPNGGHVVSLSYVYMDESGSHDKSPLLCVAGYVFERDNAERLSADWLKILERYGLPYFRMSECAHGNGAFAALSKSDRVEVQTALIPLVRRYTEVGMATVVSESLWDQVMGPIMKPGQFYTAYMFCVTNVNHLIKHWARTKGRYGPYAFIFESGHKDQSTTNKVMNDRIKDPDRMRQMFYSYTFMEGANSPPLQAADMLAWQLFTNTKNQLEGKRKTRADLRALARPQDFMDIYDRKRLVEMKNDFRQRAFEDFLRGKTYK